MLPHALAEENGSHMPPHMQAVFLTHASLPSHNAADSDLINATLVGSYRNRWVRGGGFNRRVSISVNCINALHLSPLGAPKLTARVAGIESVRYDFDRFLWLLFPKGSLWDFLGKKVTSTVGIRWGHE
jgi:hypothetical protein